MTTSPVGRAWDVTPISGAVLSVPERLWLSAAIPDVAQDSALRRGSGEVCSAVSNPRSGTTRTRRRGGSRLSVRLRATVSATVRGRPARGHILGGATTTQHSSPLSLAAGQRLSPPLQGEGSNASVHAVDRRRTGVRAVTHHSSARGNAVDEPIAWPNGTRDGRSPRPRRTVAGETTGALRTRAAARRPA